MPIVNCFYTGDCETQTEGLIQAWAEESGQSSEHMTVNLISVESQGGVSIPMLAQLYLPSLWSDEKIHMLKKGLAKALTKSFALNNDQVEVLVHIVDAKFIG